MVHVHMIAAVDLEWAFYVVSLLVSVLPDRLLPMERMGFGRRGFGLGRGLGLFRVFRIVFVLLFTTLLGPIVLVALIAFVAYWFFTSRQGR